METEVMRNIAALWIAVVVLAFGLSVEVLNAQQNQKGTDANDQIVGNKQEGQKEPPVLSQKREPAAAMNQSHVVTLQPEGKLVGIANRIDPHSLQRVPAAEVDIAFVQNRRIIAQVRTNSDGEFGVNGLSPRAVYSLIARSRGSYCAFSIVVMAHDATEQSVSLRDDVPIRVAIHATANLQQPAGSSLDVDMIPFGDVAAVGLPPGLTMGQPPALSAGPPPPVGGGGDGSAGSALGAVALGFGIAAVADDDDQATPFIP